MTSTVWKYPVPITDHFTIRMPFDAKPLAVMVQHGEPQLWALVVPTQAAVERYFRIAGTGHQINDRIKAYIGSFQMAEGDLVFHLFEIDP